MSIVQIAKITHRVGNLVDLPQLDSAEFGFAEDQKRLFIGKSLPNENVEVLTAYSQIAFDQIDGAVGNLQINPGTLENGQPLVFNGDNWVNRGGSAGGLITLGDISNVKITGGATSYVIETDGLGNLSWSPKSSIVAMIQNVTKANPAVVTSETDNLFTDGVQITITNALGMTELNGNTYYANVLTSNTFALYSDSSLTTPINSTGYGQYAYTNVSATDSSTNRVTVGNSTPFTSSQSIKFLGGVSANTNGNITNLQPNVIYYVHDKPTGTTLRISTSNDGNVSNIVPLGTVTSLTANVYAPGGRALHTLSGSGGGGGGFAAGSDQTIQYNQNNILGASPDFKYNYTTKELTINGNINSKDVLSNGNVSGTRFISTVATGTSPLLVSSTTRVPNLNVSYSNVSDFASVTAQTTGTYYPALVNNTTNGNYAIAANPNISMNIGTGALSVRSLVSSSNISGNVITANAASISGNLSVSGTANLSGNLSVGNLSATSGTFTANISSNNIAITNSLYVGGTFSAAGNATLQSNLSVLGTANITGNVTLSNVSVTSANVTTNLTVGGNAIVSGNISANNASVANVTATGNLQVNGNANVNTNLTVTGSANVGNLFAQVANVSAVNSSGHVGVGGNLAVSGNAEFSGSNVTLGPVSNVRITGGTSGYVLSTDGTGNLTFTSPGSIGVQPAGSNTQIQFNDGGSLGASGGLSFNKVSNSFSVSGNVTAANLIGNHVGNGSQLSSLTGANVTGAVANATYADSSGTATTATSATTAGTVTTSAQPNITSVGSLTSLVVNGSTNTNGNATVTNGNIQISGTGRYIGNASGLNNIPGANVTGTVANAAYATNAGTAATATTATTATSATTAGTVTTAAQPNITSTGTLTSLSVGGTSTLTGATTVGGNLQVNGQTLGVAGNLTVGKTFAVSESSTFYGPMNINGGSNTVSITSSNINFSGNLTSTGSGNIVISGSGRYVGNGSGLTNLPGANVTGTVANATYATSAGSSSTSNYATSAGSASTAGKVTNSSQPNITSVGTLGSLVVSGGISSGGNPVVTTNDFANLASDNGWCQLPNGLILQWGYVNAYITQGARVITFPRSFNTACFNVSISIVTDSRTTSSADNIAQIVQNTKSVNGFTAMMQDTDGGYSWGFMWMAIGM